MQEFLVDDAAARKDACREKNERISGVKSECLQKTFRGNEQDAAEHDASCDDVRARQVLLAEDCNGENQKHHHFHASEEFRIHSRRVMEPDEEQKRRDDAVARAKDDKRQDFLSINVADLLQGWEHTERQHHEECREDLAQDEQGEWRQCSRQLLSKGVIGRAGEDQCRERDIAQCLRGRGTGAETNEWPVLKL